MGSLNTLFAMGQVQTVMKTMFGRAGASMHNHVCYITASNSTEKAVWYRQNGCS